MENNQKLKTRSFRDIFGDYADNDTSEQNVSGAVELEISRLIPFKNHPFKLYEGERLSDMVKSISEFGVILPVVVRPREDGMYQILSGHNRVSAAKFIGIEKVPAVIKEGLTDEEALLIVTETNLVQRSFSDLSHSERAIVLSRHYDAIKQQGKRNDLINEIEKLSKPHEINTDKSCSQVGNKTKSITKVGEQYNLSKNTVARYIRLNELIPELLSRVDNEEIAFIPGVVLSFITKEEQQDIERIMNQNNFKIDMAKADILRSSSETGNLTSDRIYEILSGEFRKKKKANNPAPIKLKSKLISKYFSPEQKQSEIEDVIEKALALYFEQLNPIEVNT